jgi:hypothetical protein
MRFTIVTPHFKQLDWLRLCVASVADQAGESVLIIEHIIQDAGTPGIEDFARQHSAAFSSDTSSFEMPFDDAAGTKAPYRLSIHRESDAGIYETINRGFRRATGGILAWLNADEQYLPGTLRKVADAFQAHPKAEILFVDTVVTDTGGQFICSRTAVKPQRLHSLVSGNLSFLSAANFLRKAAIDKDYLIPEGWRSVGDAASADAHRGLPHEHSSCYRYRRKRKDIPAADASGRRPSRDRAPMAATAPAWARTARPLRIAGFRGRKLLAGSYYLQPFDYEVFTIQQPATRQRFRVPRPTQRWRGR